MNPFLAPGRLTSGRRTHKGNRLVGGVANSRHLDGSAGDYTGTTADALRAFFGNGAKIIPESDHLHVQGLPPGTFPYFGNKGVAGLANGVDTTAPKGALPVPAKPRTLADIAKPDMGAMPVGLNAQPMAPQAGTLADLANGLPQGKVPGHKGIFKGNDLAAIAGILGDALMAYGGLQPQFGPRMARQESEEADRAFDREKFNATLEAKRQEAMAPPQWLEDAMLYNRLPEPQKEMVGAYRDVVNPIVADVQGEDGSVIRRIMPRKLAPKAGTVEQGYMFMGGDPADPANWRKQ
jgi:hypothetical protein